MESLLLTYAAELLAITLLGVIAALVGFRVARSDHRAGLVLAGLGLAAFIFLPTSAMLLPGLYHTPQPLPITINLIEAMGFLLLGVALQRSVGTSSGRVLVSVLAVLAVFYVLRGPVSLLIVGQRYATLSGTPGETHVLQSTYQTCAPACAATILHSFGLPLTEGELAARCRTTFFGTSKFGIIRGMREAAAARGQRLAFEVRIGLDGKDLLTLPCPAILTVKINGLGHAVVLLGTTPDGARLRIGDPLKQTVQTLSPQRLEKRYRFQGDALIVRRVRR